MWILVRKQVFKMWMRIQLDPNQ